MQRHATKEAALTNVYGYAAFRGVQADAIDAVVERGHDVLVVMATGGGKSLCYQIPALVLGRAAVVVSPLVSLMQDQVAALESKGLAACFLGSAQPDASLWQRLNTFQFVYVTPELVGTERFRIAMEVDVRPCLVAVDEAHCVSEWGFDFRPEYRQIKEAVRSVTNCPIVAVTATATERTRQDILLNLGLRPDARTVLTTTVDRANLVYTAVHRKDMDALTHAVLGGREERTNGGSTIVYVPTVKEVETVAAAILRSSETRARRGADDPRPPLRTTVATYHGQMDTAERARVHHAFLRDEITVVVATLAFGMGIDKPDVRLVVHWGAPKTVEAYYQQAGRAGRDGDPARCVLFTSTSDWPALQRLLTRGADAATAARAMAGLRGMRAFCETRTCRRRALADYFGEVHDDAAPVCGACDVCLAASPSRSEERVDATALARHVLDAVAALGGRYGLTTVHDVCRGACKHERLRTLPCYGAAPRATVAELHHATDACRAHGLLLDTVVDLPERSYASIEITEAGTAWRADPNAATLLAPPPTFGTQAASSKKRRVDADSGDEARLLHRLRSVRHAVANGIPPYMVCSDATLRDMMAKRPKTRTELLAVSGIGAHKADKYGDAFLAVFRA